MVEAVKDPRKVRAGKAGSRARWGEHGRIVRLDNLAAPVRAAVVALIEADRAAKAAADASTPEAA